MFSREVFPACAVSFDTAWLIFREGSVLDRWERLDSDCHVQVMDRQQLPDVDVERSLDASRGQHLSEAAFGRSCWPLNRLDLAGK